MINIQNTHDNECFKWFIVRYLNPANHHPARITKADKDFAIKLYFKYIKLPVEISDIHKVENKSSIDNSVFSYEYKEGHRIYVSKRSFEEKHVDLLLIGEERKRYYVLIKEFKTFMYNYPVYHAKIFLLFLFRSFLYRRNIKMLY